MLAADVPLNNSLLSSCVAIVCLDPVPADALDGTLNLSAETRDGTPDLSADSDAPECLQLACLPLPTELLGSASSFGCGFAVAEALIESPIASEFGGCIRAGVGPTTASQSALPEA